MAQNSKYSLPAGTKVLITGATGFTGSLLTRKLLLSGCQVRAIARPSSDTSSLSDLPIEWFKGQVYDEQLLINACQGVEYIFHVAAAFRQAGIADKEYHDVHVISTKLLAKLALSSSTFKRLIHVSTMGVHGHIENPPGNEDSAFSPGDIYQVTKAEAETWLHEFGKEHRLPYTVIRPCGIFGPGDKRLFKVFKMATRRIFPILGQGKCLYHLIHVEDLTDAIILSATHPKAVGEAFLCGNSSAIPLSAMANIIAKTLGSSLNILRLPVTPFFILGDLCEVICKPLGIEPPIYRRRVAFFTKDRSFDTGKIKRLLGFETSFSNETGIIDTAKWYRQQGWL